MITRTPELLPAPNPLTVGVGGEDEKTMTLRATVMVDDVPTALYIREGLDKADTIDDMMAFGLTEKGGLDPESYDDNRTWEVAEALDLVEPF